MVLRASFQLNTSISGCQLSGLPQGKGTTFPRQKQEKTAFCVVNRALKSYYIGTQEGCEAVRAILGRVAPDNFFLFGVKKYLSGGVKVRAARAFIIVRGDSPPVRAIFLLKINSQRRVAFSFCAELFSFLYFFSIF